MRVLMARNQFLRSLPAADAARLAPHLELVRLEKPQVLFRAREPLRLIHFPLGAVISLVVRLESGQALEVGLVGRDGIAETAVFPGIASISCDGVLQIPGEALRISADFFRRTMQAHESLCCAAARYAQLVLVRSMQMAACNVFHSVEQRCVRWLLTMHDLTGEPELPLTQELAATMLGVRRPTMTAVLGALRRTGLVREARGRLRILDRERMERAACECYRVMRDDQRRLLAY